MMATSEDRGEARPVSLWGAVLRVLLSVVLAGVAQFWLVRVIAVVEVLLDTDTLWGPWAPRTALLLGKGLLIAVASVGGVMWLRPWKAVSAISDARDEDRPQTLETAVLSALLGFLGLVGLASAAGAVAGMFVPRGEHPVVWLPWINLLLFLLISGGAFWGLFRLKPRTGSEPISPATRKTNALFGLGGILATVSCLAVIFHTMDVDRPTGFFTNSPVALWVAAFAITTWLVAWAISWWWYVSADEHEQRASDVGLLAGGFLFAAVTPAWWVAARAGLMPQPDAMILWVAVNLVWVIGWFWRRNR